MRFSAILHSLSKRWQCSLLLCLLFRNCLKKKIEDKTEMQMQSMIQIPSVTLISVELFFKHSSNSVDDSLPILSFSLRESKKKIEKRSTILRQEREKKKKTDVK